jgi:hypothetical protein
MFSNDPSTRRLAYDNLVRGPYLVIIDPISMMHKDIFQHAIVNCALHVNERAFLIGISPYISGMHADLFDPIHAIERKLEVHLEKAYARYRKPFYPVNNACILNVEHESQLSRWFQVAADSIMIARKTPIPIKGVHPAYKKRFQQLPGHHLDQNMCHIGAHWSGSP